MKFDICSTHKRGVGIKHFRLQIQAVMLTNPLFHTVMLFPGKKYLCVLTAANNANIIYEACVWQIVLLHAFYFYRLIFYIKGLLGTKPYKT